MTALYRSDRRAEALRTYGDLRSTLADELGIEPGPDVTALEEAILFDDLETLNPNMVGGDPYSGACTIDQFLTWRPTPGSRNHETGVKGLFHIGASTHPGPGLGGNSGFMVASKLT